MHNKKKTQGKFNHDYGYKNINQNENRYKVEVKKEMATSSK